MDTKQGTGRKQLEGKIAVISGGGRGIGRALAVRFAEEGATVVVSSRTKPDLDAVVTTVVDGGGAALAVVADAMDRESAREPVRQAVHHFGRVDVLVNNVGGSIGRDHDPFTGDDDSFESTLVLSLTSAWWTTREVLPHMRAHGGGAVINIGSGAAKRASGSVAYTTAKHGLVGFTRALAARAAGAGITVNCLCPGWTNTAMVDWEGLAARGGVSIDQAQELARNDNLQHRILEPEELTGMATLLASSDGRGITGQVISVDGGYRV